MGDLAAAAADDAAGAISVSVSGGLVLQLHMILSSVVSDAVLLFSVVFLLLISNVIADAITAVDVPST